MTKINLNDIGLSDYFLEEARKYEGENYYLARVSAQHREIYKILTQSGEINALVSGKFNFMASESADYPAVGDWVLVDKTDEKSGNAVIHHVLARKSWLERKVAGTGLDRQIIASNIDIIFICMSLNQDFNLRRIERYLSMAWDSKATPVILLTKADLCEDISTKLKEINAVALGVDVVIISSFSGNGYTELSKYFQNGKTVAFIGSSGVGKSTLTNRLMGEEVLETNEIRDNQKGKHTTTFRQLLLLPSGGVVIDTPGMRELQITVADLSRSFSDIEELAAECRFKDCRHESEPQCAVKNAIKDGRLPPERLENFKKLQREMAFEKRKNTMNAAKAEKQKFIDMMGSINNYKEIQKRNKKN